MRLWGRPRERLRVCAGARERSIPRPYRGPPPPPPFPTSRSALRSRARPPAIFVVFVGSRQSTFGPIRNTRKLHDRAPRPPVVSLGSCVRLRSRLVPPQCNTHTSAELIFAHPTTIPPPPPLAPPPNPSDDADNATEKKLKWRHGPVEIARLHGSMLPCTRRHGDLGLREPLRGPRNPDR